MTPIIMPQVGQDIPTGKIVEWIKGENDAVEKGEVILIVESEKATFEVEADESGVLASILYQAGEEAEVLKPIAYIVQPGDTLAPAAGAEQAAAADTQEPLAQQVTPSVAAPDEPPPTARLNASPSARRIAGERGVNLADIEGTGPGGRVIKRDLSGSRTAGAAQLASEDEVVPFGKVRKRMAERLTHSKQNIPHFYLLADVDMTDAVAWRKEFNERQGTHITITDLIIRATGAALQQHRRLNGHVEEDKIVLKKQINIGVAVAVEEGLLVPVIAEADKKSLQEVSELAHKNAASARRGLMASKCEGTFTITSLGMYDVREFVPIINPPECAILAVGAIQRRVVVVSGGTGVREVMALTLACDHRAVDGADAAGLLKDIKENLQSVSRWE